jgi:hypothetical protein
VRIDFPATVTPDGALTISDPLAWRVALAKFRGRPVRVSVSSIRKPGSKAQQGYYFGAICSMIAAETGHTVEEVHDSEALTKLRRVPDDKLGWIVQSYMEMSTVEREEYHSRVRTWAAEFFGFTIPLPNEPIGASL